MVSFGLSGLERFVFREDHFEFEEVAELLDAIKMNAGAAGEVEDPPQGIGEACVVRPGLRRFVRDSDRLPPTLGNRGATGRRAFSDFTGVGPPTRSRRAPTAIPNRHRERRERVPSPPDPSARW